jgi:hypothetical protein
MKNRYHEKEKRSGRKGTGREEDKVEKIIV